MKTQIRHALKFLHLLIQAILGPPPASHPKARAAAFFTL